MKINFCQWCGGPTKHDIPEGEEKIRAICTLCGKITYQNPKMVGLIKAQVILRLTIFFFDRKPGVNILIEKEVQKEDEESSRQKKN